jgi:hypothetical protein
MITLYHAQGTDSGRNVEKLEFKNFKELKKYFSFLIDIDDKEKVYLMSFNNSERDLNTRDQDVFVHENIFAINKYLDFMRAFMNCNEFVFLQEYKSYESAYNVALCFREESRLCYDLQNT